MEPSDSAPVLDPEVVAFIHSGIAAGVATRDDALRPALTRGWGPEVSADRRSLTICAAAPVGSSARANLERNGAVAVGFSPPTIARAVQVKGVAAKVSEPGAADLERTERHFGLFAAECERIGAPLSVAGRMLVRAGLVLISFTIDEAFDQTPGPTAGRRL